MLLLASCQSDLIKNESSLAEAEFIAVTEGFEAETKTTLSSDGRVLWKSGDQLSIFTGFTLNKQYQVNDASDGKTTAGFSSVNSGSSDEFYAGSDIPANVAYYPYSSETEIRKSGSEYSLAVDLPSTQTYAEGSFGSGAFPMVAVTSSTSDNYLKFKNVLGGIKLQLTGNMVVSSIKIKGKNGEILCGPATVTAGNSSLPVVTLSDASATTVTLDCGEDGVALDRTEPTDFIIALPPVTFEKGFEVEICRKEGHSEYLSTDKVQSITRSNLLKMPERGLHFIECCFPSYRTMTDHHVDFCGDCVAGFRNPQCSDKDYTSDALTVTWPGFNVDVLAELDLSYEMFLEEYDTTTLYVLDVTQRSNGTRDTTFINADQYLFPAGVTYYSMLSKEIITTSDIISLYVDSEAEIPSENTIEFAYKAKRNSPSTPDIGFKFSYTVSPRTQHIHDNSGFSSIRLNPDYILGPQNKLVETPPADGYDPVIDGYRTYGAVVARGRHLGEGVFDFSCHLNEHFDEYGANVHLDDDSMIRFEIVQSSDDVVFVSDAGETDVVSISPSDFSAYNSKYGPFVDLKYKGAFLSKDVCALIKVSEICGADGSVACAGYYYVIFKAPFELRVNREARLLTINGSPSKVYISDMVSIVESYYGEESNVVCTFMDGAMRATEYGKSIYGLSDKPASLSFKPGMELEYPYPNNSKPTFGGCLIYGSDASGLYLLWDNLGTDLLVNKFADFNIVAQVEGWGGFETSGVAVVMSTANSKTPDMDIVIPQKDEHGSSSGSAGSITSISYPEQNSTISLPQGESYTICVKVNPADTDESLIISPSIACPVVYDVSHDKGSPYWFVTVTAIATKTGRGALCIDSENYSTLCYINVYKIGVEGLSLDESELTMRVGEAKTMLAAVMPANASNKGITWTSSDTSVAYVSQSGVVTAKKAGKVVITATSKDNSSARARCTVLIRENSVDGGTAEGVGFKEWN